MAIPESAHILQAVIEATPDAIFVKDLDGRYVVVNAAAARFLGRAPADIIGKHDLELYPEDTAKQFIADDQRVLAAGRPLYFEGVAQSPTGVQAYLVTKGPYRDQHGIIRGLFGISHDTTELRQANESLEQTREALFHAQKMEIVGQLTGGLAHDFNNALSVILGNLDLLRLHLKNDPPARDLLDTVIRAAAHAQDLTANLLAFARRRQLHPQPLDVDALIDAIARLLSRTLPPRVSLIREPYDQPHIAVVDRAALESAILNVLLNARDALGKAGTIHVSTAHAAITADRRAHGDPEPGRYVVIAVQDTGAGMTPDVLAQVFKPFFTTKAAEGGTGLGLSMVHGFAKQSGGTVQIQSAPGAGTTVRILLPAPAVDPA